MTQTDAPPFDGKKPLRRGSCFLELFQRRMSFLLLPTPHPAAVSGRNSRPRACGAAPARTERSMVFDIRYCGASWQLKRKPFVATTDAPEGAAMAENKTKATEASVERYFSTIEDAARRNDCEALAELMTKATNQPPTMWGTSIVGFGSYHYTFASGREGDSCLSGFASRKGDISVYLTSFPRQDQLLAKLGKHKLGKGCLYVRTLSDVDLNILEQLIVGSVAERKRQYG
jgi:hypothetical protein